MKHGSQSPKHSQGREGVRWQLVGTPEPAPVPPPVRARPPLYPRPQPAALKPYPLIPPPLGHLDVLRVQPQGVQKHVLQRRAG